MKYYDKQRENTVISMNYYDSLIESIKQRREKISIPPKKIINTHKKQTYTINNKHQTMCTTYTTSTGSYYQFVLATQNVETTFESFVQLFLYFSIFYLVVLVLHDAVSNIL